MDHFNFKHLAVAGLIASGLAGQAFAATSNDFVDTAAAGGIAEVEAGKLAQEKSASADIKAFASEMVKDHTAANHELTALAKKLDLQVPDDAALTAKAKKMILEMRDESFDKAYTNNQVKAHEDTVALFKKEADTSDNPELKAWAAKTLPKIEHHLDQAKALQTKYNP
ncbi:MAG: DUF4142 domain-containing protein [Pseudomonas sp.]|uniref:DUF4142 domain-containing protein n=1 Tax=Pseudomonas abieticivorans TaxID=2931382 RepID=UPI0020BFB02F|nr:DUF4142 domain-containing protein [Pseudomonas sp. PIA16]MDE1164569.1 DUF4142 domain-containing protein [Pseudomonas sp.]